MAGNTTLSTVFDRVWATTQTSLIPMVWDNFTTDIPLIHELQEAGNKEEHSGGVALDFIVAKEAANAVGAGPTQKITPVYLDPATRGRYEWKFIYVPFKVPGQDLKRNEGPAAVVDLLQMIIDVVVGSLTEALGGTNFGVWSTADETTAARVTGLGNLIKSSGNSSGTTGNISRTNAFWQNSTGTTITSFATNGRAGWLSAMLNAKRGNELPNLIATTKTQYQNFITASTGTVTYNAPIEGNVSGNRSLDLGTPNVYFHGAKVLADANAEATTARFINTKYLKLRVHAKYYLTLREFMYTEDEDAISSTACAMLNLCATSLARHAIVTGGDTA